MEKYKTGEAISKLSVDDKLEFICIESGLKMCVSKLGYIKVTEDNDEGNISGNITPFDYWELIKEPVDFMEAIKAYNEGRTILCKAVYYSEQVEFLYKPTNKTRSAGDGHQIKTVEDLSVTTREVLEGKWYIMEDEE